MVYGPGTALNAAQIVMHVRICFLSTCLISLKQNGMSKVKIRKKEKRKKKANNSDLRVELTGLIS